jgi:hypothetical protein
MKQLLGAILFLALAGCSGSARLMDQPEPVSVAHPTKQVPPHNVPLAARAEAPKSANESKGTPLMECMSESCRVKCSATLAKQSKPGARILRNRYEIPRPYAVLFDRIDTATVYHVPLRQASNFSETGRASAAPMPCT